jgi:N-acetylmuramoyl-L-alanine amidase
MKVSDTDILVATLTIHGEARGCTQEGRTAIAHCILNRAKAKAWWGRGTPYPDHSVTAVCLKPFQFSCWNNNDPNRSMLKQLEADYRGAIQQKTCRAALKAFIDALDGYVADPTGGATHYLTTRLHQSPRCPAWAAGNQNFVEIGAHRFFAGIK